ncbi:membrane protein A31 [Aotine betaherpesvirus 1]|uniref:Membrane protein A31 n=1 Tax=Aotine betaherpesvirus 1 TaxID=50290 RepID=G8XUK5_9BETA|nr:membrane protein A31 [Aotine betaherpesvirus 1]AEV80847.1 membrane protein A31 [Aotine betaherpesvirus 1]
MTKLTTKLGDADKPTAKEHADPPEKVPMMPVPVGAKLIPAWEPVTRDGKPIFPSRWGTTVLMISEVPPPVQAQRWYARAMAAVPRVYTILCAMLLGSMFAGTLWLAVPFFSQFIAGNFPLGLGFTALSVLGLYILCSCQKTFTFDCFLLGYIAITKVTAISTVLCLYHTLVVVQGVVFTGFLFTVLTALSMFLRLNGKCVRWVLTVVLGMMVLSVLWLQRNVGDVSTMVVCGVMLVSYAVLVYDTRMLFVMGYGPREEDELICVGELYTSLMDAFLCVVYLWYRIVEANWPLETLTTVTP